MHINRGHTGDKTRRHPPIIAGIIYNTGQATQERQIRTQHKTILANKK